MAELPKIPPKHLKNGCYARADALEAHLEAAKAEVVQLRGTLSLAERSLRESWASEKRLAAELAEIKRTREQENARLRTALEKIAKHRLRGRKTQGALLAEEALKGDI